MVKTNASFRSSIKGSGFSSALLLIVTPMVFNKELRKSCNGKVGVLPLS